MRRKAEEIVRLAAEEEARIKAEEERMKAEEEERRIAAEVEAKRLALEAKIEGDGKHLQRSNTVIMIKKLIYRYSTIYYIDCIKIKSLLFLGAKDR